MNARHLYSGCWDRWRCSWRLWRSRRMRKMQSRSKAIRGNSIWLSCLSLFAFLLSNKSLYCHVITSLLINQNKQMLFIFFLFFSFSVVHRSYNRKIFTHLACLIFTLIIEISQWTGSQWSMMYDDARVHPCISRVSKIVKFVVEPNIKQMFWKSWT